MFATNDLDIKEHLIQDIINKKRKTSEVATILRVSMRTVQKRICRYEYNGIQGLVRSKPGPKRGKAYNKTPEETEEIVAFLAMKYKNDQLT